MWVCVERWGGFEEGCLGPLGDASGPSAHLRSQEILGWDSLPSHRWEDTHVPCVRALVWTGMREGRKELFSPYKQRGKAGPYVVRSPPALFL